MIYLETSGGLGNRLRAISSAIKLADEYGDRVFVIWKNTEDCRCYYDDFFRMEAPNVIVLDERKKELGCINLLVWKWTVYTVRKKRFYKNEECDKFLSEYKKCKFRRFVGWYIDTYEDFYEGTNYSFFPLKEEMVRKVRLNIDEVLKHDGRRIGLHIRRTDNDMSIELSPLYLFEDAITNEINYDSNTVFYLATDDPAIKVEFIQKYGARIITDGIHAAVRNTRDGMEEAVIELFSLASMDKIIGSYWSSFSETAAKVGNIELIQLKK